MAVATSSIFNQIETETALAILKPASKSNGPANPPKKMIPVVLALLPGLKNNLRLLLFLKLYG